MWPAPKRASSPPKLNGPCTGKMPARVGTCGGAAGLGGAGLLAATLRRTTTGGRVGLWPGSAPPTPALVAVRAGVTPGVAPPTEPSLTGVVSSTSPPGAAPPVFAAAELVGSTGTAAPRAMRRREVARSDRAILLSVGTRPRLLQARKRRCAASIERTCALRDDSVRARTAERLSDAQQPRQQRERPGLRQRLVEV